jgi:hypothetical protein
MTRLSAANGDACPVRPARALGGEAAFRFAEAWARRPAKAVKLVRRHPVGAADRRPLIPPAVFIGVTIAILCVIALTLQHLRLERDLALTAGAWEVDMRATLLAQRLDAALSADPQASEGEVFRRVLEAHPDERLAQSILIDRSGRVVEFEQTQDGSDLRLAHLARRARPSASGDIQGGATRIETERGDRSEAPAGRLGDGGLCFARRWSSRRLAPHGADDGLPTRLDRRADARGGGPLCA